MKVSEPLWVCPMSGAAYTAEMRGDGRCLGCGATLEPNMAARNQESQP